MQLSKYLHVTSVTYLPVGKLVSTHQPGAQNVLASLAARNFVARSNCSLLSQHEACCSTGSLQLRSLGGCLYCSLCGALRYVAPLWSQLTSLRIFVLLRIYDVNSVFSDVKQQ